MQEAVLPLTLELLSPCFMGGAHQQPELRIASLRGLWRYWYRALYGQGDERKPVSGEVELFGDTTCRGRARLFLRESVRELPEAQWARGQRRGADYLLFSMDMNKRRYLKPGSRVSLELRVAGTDEDRTRSGRSLAVALAFSGLGARARRMAGAVHLAAARPQELVPVEPAADPAALAARLRALIGPVFGRRVRDVRYHVVARGFFRAGVLLKTYQDWQTALDCVGTVIREFRSRRQPDYDLARAIIQGRPPDPRQTITRAAFGLPITFRFRSLQGQSVTVQLPESDRRGSPLFLTLERLEGGRLAVVWSLFRAPLTQDGRIQIRNSGTALPAPESELVERMLSEPAWRSHVVAE